MKKLFSFVLAIFLVHSFCLVTTFNTKALAANANPEVTVSAPSNLEAVASEVRIKLTWNPVQNSRSTAGYAIYRSTNLNSRFQRIGSTKDSTFSDTTAKKGVMYYYYVRTYDIGGNLSIPSNIARAIIGLEDILGNDASRRVEVITEIEDQQKSLTPPIKVLAGARENTIRIIWSPTETFAKGYAVYRSTDPNSRFTKIGESEGTVFVDSYPEPNTIYYYYIRAYDTDVNLSLPSEMTRAMVW